VLDKQQSAAGLQDAQNLPKRLLLIRNTAQHKRANHRIDTAIFDR
jgi:hypothetical protein